MESGSYLPSQHGSRSRQVDLFDEGCVRILTLLHEVEMAWKWPTNASTLLFFLIPKSVTSERPIALLPTLFQLVGVVSSVVEWQSKFNITWEAPHMRSQSLVLHRSPQVQVPRGRSLELVLHQRQWMKTVLVPRIRSLEPVPHTRSE